MSLYVTKFLFFNPIFSEISKEKMNGTTNGVNGTGSGRHRARNATHAGSWYSDVPKELDRQLSDWLEKAGPQNYGPARAIISP